MPELTGRMDMEHLIDAAVCALQKMISWNTRFWHDLKCRSGLGWSIIWCATYFWNTSMSQAVCSWTYEWKSWNSNVLIAQNGQWKFWSMVVENSSVLAENEVAKRIDKVEGSSPWKLQVVRGIMESARKD